MVRGVIALMALFGCLLLASPAQAQVGPGGEASLQEILEKGLKVRRAKEKAFVRRVVALVKQRVFKRPLVTAVFNKARQRHSKFPFIYFRTMMRTIAKKRDITL